MADDVVKTDESLGTSEPLFDPSPMDDTDYLSGGEMTQEAMERFGLTPETEDGEAAGGDAQSASEDDADDADEDDAKDGAADETKEDAEIGRRVREMLANDRAGLAKFVLEHMSEDERSEVLEANETGGDSALALPEDSDVTGEWEADVVRRINAFPKAMETHTTEMVGRLAPYVDGAAATGVIALKMVQAMAQVMGVELPTVTVDDMSKVARTGKSWEDAFESVAGKTMKKAVARAQRARAATARPVTLGAQGQGMPEAAYGDSMADIARKLLGRG
jgi:hypothetical protein